MFVLREDAISQAIFVLRDILFNQKLNSYGCHVEMCVAGSWWGQITPPLSMSRVLVVS